MLFPAAPPSVRGIPGGGACGVFYSACYSASPPPGWWWVDATRRAGDKHVLFCIYTRLSVAAVYSRWFLFLKCYALKIADSPKVAVSSRAITICPFVERLFNMEGLHLAAALQTRCDRPLFVNEIQHTRRLTVSSNASWTAEQTILFLSCLLQQWNHLPIIAIGRN